MGTKEKYIIAALTSVQHDAYLESMMNYIGEKEVAITAESDGRIKERRELIVAFWKLGTPIAQIASATKLKEDEIHAIIEKYGGSSE